MYSAKKRTLPRGAALPSLFSTVDDYHLGMTNSVQIAELKSRLSEYLRRVRRGETITVLDRETPIARLEPIAGDRARAVVRDPGAGAPRLRDLHLPPTLRTQIDILDLLAQERGVL